MRWLAEPPVESQRCGRACMFGHGRGALQTAAIFSMVAASWSSFWRLASASSLLVPLALGGGVRLLPPGVAPSSVRSPVVLVSGKGELRSLLIASSLLGVSVCWGDLAGLAAGVCVPLAGAGGLDDAAALPGESTSPLSVPLPSTSMAGWSVGSGLGLR